MVPYIGITDFTERYQVLDMSQVLSALLLDESECLLHVGVMMSYKTLNNIPSRWQTVFPPKERIADIFSSKEVYNCLHYADYDGIALRENLARAISFGGDGICAVQLDMVWPDSDEIARGVRDSHKQVEIILQIGKNAFEAVGDTPKGVVRRLGEYEGFIHRVLLDKSMGRGIGMDAQALVPFVLEIREHFPMLGIGVAGGLCAQTIRVIEPLIKVLPDLSIDAQGKLRPSGSALDPIDWGMAGMYLTEATHFLCTKRE